jgi:hypothetical protein
MKRALSWLALLGCHVAFAPSAWACAACFGKSDSALAHGMNAGIFTLLAVIGTMLLCVASFFVFVVRRAARIDSAGESSAANPQP